MNRTKPFLMLGLLGLLVPTLGCGAPRAGSPSDRIVVSISDDSANFNPMSPTRSNLFSYIEGVFMRADSTGVLRPDAVTSIEPDPNGLSWLVTLRHGALFSEGSEITVHDLASSVDAATWRTNPRSGPLLFGGYAGVEVVSPSQIRVRFTRVWSPARTYLAEIGVWPARLIERIKAAPDTIRLAPADLVTAGPYRISEYRPKSAAMLDPVGDGFGLIVRFEDPEAGYAEFRKGNRDLQYVEPRKQSRYRSLPGVAVLTYEYQEAITLVLNMKRGTLTGENPTLREACLLVVNAEAARKLVAAEGSSKADGRLWVTPHENFNHTDASRLVAGYDPGRARALLDAAGFLIGADGWRRDNSGRPFELVIVTYGSISEYEPLIVSIGDEIERELRIRTEKKVYSPVVYEDVMTGRQQARWDLMVGEWPFHSELDPSLTLAVASVSVPGGPTGSGRNFPRLEDRAVDKACEAADSAIDATGRAVASQVLHARLLGLHAVKPLYFARDGWAVSKRIALPRADDRRIKRTIQYWANTLGLKSDHSEEPSR